MLRDGGALDCLRVPISVPPDPKGGGSLELLLGELVFSFALGMAMQSVTRCESYRLRAQTTAATRGPPLSPPD